jgi:hypothetical protein
MWKEQRATNLIIQARGRTSSKLNEPNKKIEFGVSVDDAFVHPINADCFTIFDIVDRVAGGEFRDAEHIKLVDNTFSHLFRQIESRKQGRTLDRIDWPGQTSTATATRLFSKSVSGDLLVGGFTTIDEVEHKYNTVLFPVRLLFSFLSDYEEFT